MAKQLTTYLLVSWLLIGSGAALGQVSSPDLKQLQERFLVALDDNHAKDHEQVTFVATKTHTVRNGESLWGISRAYRVDFNELARLNGLSTINPVIRIGQRLKIPDKADSSKGGGSRRTPSSYITHRVAANETLFKIGRRYRVSMKVLTEVNNLADPNTLRIGQTIRVPVYGKAPAPPKTRPKSPSPPKQSPPAERKPEYAPYTVQPGDTIQSIAKLYGITPTALLRLNSRAATPKYQPRVGERVMVPTDGTWYVPQTNQPAPSPPAGKRITSSGSVAPAPASSAIKHTVAPNDTLGKLAQRFGTTVQQIKLDNPKIKSDKDLRVGTDLRIRAR